MQAFLLCFYFDGDVPWHRCHTQDSIQGLSASLWRMRLKLCSPLVMYPPGGWLPSFLQQHPRCQVKASGQKMLVDEGRHSVSVCISCLDGSG